MRQSVHLLSQRGHVHTGRMCVCTGFLRTKVGAGLANPQRVSTEIIIEIKQLYSGRIASNPFIASNSRYMVFPLSNAFLIENGHFGLKHKRNRRKSSKSIEHKSTH